jgi:uncharacterized protein
MTRAVSPGSVHAFDSERGRHLLVADGSRIFDLAPELALEVDAAALAGEQAIAGLLERYGLASTPYIDDVPLQDPPIRALSLAVAQKCNLGCAYCYAQGGEFGGPPKNMSWDVARAAVERLLESAERGQRVNLAFLGGEPLVNRRLIRQATEFAAGQAQARGIHAGFSITTNGTLINPEDASFFEEYGFAVTVSVDGIGDTHDRLRPFRGGDGSYARIMARVKPLLDRQRRMQVSARVTVTPLNIELQETLDELIALGFHSVGFSPMLSAPMQQLELQQPDLMTMLDEMMACGRKFESETIAGHRYPFSNMTEALRQIHRGTHRPYSCGAGAGYFGVSADGGLFACHRFVDDEAGHLGDVKDGLRRDKRNGWLAERHVHRQEPCSKCWARYLCGGGCHHEVIYRGRPACDFIRGWLHYCLVTYVNVMEQQPDYFSSEARSEA